MQQGFRDMGTLRSATDWSGTKVDPGVTLGYPVIDDDGWYCWEYPTIPQGIIDDRGYIFVEVTEND